MPCVDNSLATDNQPDRQLAAWTTGWIVIWTTGWIFEWTTGWIVKWHGGVGVFEGPFFNSHEILTKDDLNESECQMQVSKISRLRFLNFSCILYFYFLTFHSSKTCSIVHFQKFISSFQFSVYFRKWWLHMKAEAIHQNLSSQTFNIDLNKFWIVISNHTSPFGAQ